MTPTIDPTYQPRTLAELEAYLEELALSEGPIAFGLLKALQRVGGISGPDIMEYVRVAQARLSMRGVTVSQSVQPSHGAITTPGGDASFPQAPPPPPAGPRTQSLVPNTSAQAQARRDWARQQQAQQIMEERQREQRAPVRRVDTTNRYGAMTPQVPQTPVVYPPLEQSLSPSEPQPPLGPTEAPEFTTAEFDPIADDVPEVTMPRASASIPPSAPATVIPRRGGRPRGSKNRPRDGA